MRFATYRQRTDLWKDDVSAITERQKGELIFGHINGISLLKNGKVKQIRFSEKNDYYASNKVLDLCTDRDKNVWFAAEKLGLGRLDKNNNIHWYRIPLSNDDLISSVVEDNFGKIYVASSRKLFELSGTKFKIVKNLPIFKSTFIRKIFISPENKIYLATPDYGLFVEDSNEFKIIKSNQYPNANNVYAVYFNSPKDILVGTGDGIFKVSADTLVKFKPEYFPNNYSVYFISKDLDGNYWIGTDRGVIRWDGVSIVQYTVKDGLAGMETNRDAGYLDSNGRFWIGTDRGVSEYLKEFDYKPDIFPNIILDFIEPKINLNTQEHLQNIKCVSGAFVVRAKVVSFINEERNNFLYKLSPGFDQNWNLGGSRNPLIKYINLAPGDYNLLIKSHNDKGYWNVGRTYASIDVPAPFYNSWWFYSLVTFSGVLFVIWVLMYRVKVRYSQMLEYEVEKRTETIEESERRYKQMFENNQANMLLIDSSTLKIIDGNKAAQKFYGYSLTKLVNKNYTDLTPEKYKTDNSIEIKQKILDQSLYLTRHILSNSNEVFVEINFSEIEVQGQKQYYAIINDVTERIIAELSLKDSEEKYRTLIENMTDGVFIIQNEKMVFVNYALADFLGYNTKEMTGVNFSQFVAHHNRDLVWQRYADRISGKDVIGHYEFDLIHKNGVDIVNVLMHVSVFNYKGSPATMGTIKNITESKIQELRLKQFHTVIEQAPVAVMITDTHDKIEYFNPMFCNLTGYIFEEIIGKTPSVFHINEKLEVQKKLKEEVKSGNVWSGELLHRRKNGTKFWVTSTVSPIRNTEGEITHFIFVEQDITFEKYAREEISRNEKLLSSVINHSPIIIAALDKRGFFTLARGKVLEEFGLGKDALVGVSSLDTFKHENLIYEDILRAIEGETFSEIRKFQNKVYEVHVTPFFDENNEVAGSMAVVADITERYDAEQKLISAKEEAERSDRLKSDFLAQMSHEIRTPVNTILSFTSLLEGEVKNKVSDEIKEVFNFIDDGGRRLTHTIDMILNMSQFQTDTYIPIMQKVDIDKEVLYKITTELRATAVRKNLKLIYSVDTSDTIIHGDSYTLGQIFINLIDNAIKYTNTGEIVVNIKANNGSVIASVQDTGIGISKEFIPHLFSAFSQEETGYTRRFDGTGLGLALVKKYVEINRAEIKVESKKGEGTKFSIIFNTRNGS